MIQVVITRALVLLIQGYQYLLSPLLPRSCRFHPSCSNYARQAIVKYGPLKGMGLGLLRLAKCHPFHPGGYDPVP